MVSLTEKSARFEHTLVTVEDHVATITLNRPHRRNALNYPAYDELEQSLRAAAADPDVRCVIVTGADPAFCSGDDVKQVMVGAAEATSSNLSAVAGWSSTVMDGIIRRAGPASSPG